MNSRFSNRLIANELYASECIEECIGVHKKLCTAPKKDTPKYARFSDKKEHLIKVPTSRGISTHPMAAWHSKFAAAVSRCGYVSDVEISKFETRYHKAFTSMDVNTMTILMDDLLAAGRD